MPGRNREELSRTNSVAAAIAEEEARLDALERERKDARLRLERLRQELAVLQSSPATSREIAPAGTLSAEMSASAKVALFRSLFRGRDDVYPKLWINSRSAKKGYAPACRNEWVRGVCEKPRVRCGECPNQAFEPVIWRRVAGCAPASAARCPSADLGRPRR